MMLTAAIFTKDRTTRSGRQHIGKPLGDERRATSGEQRAASGDERGNEER
jgi:hypothetical protein